MNANQNSALSSAEIAQLWSGYLNSGMSKCIFLYFSYTVEDQKLQSMLQEGIQISDAHLQKLTGFFENEGIFVPYGFKAEEDVNTAPQNCSQRISLCISFIIMSCLQ